MVLTVTVFSRIEDFGVTFPPVFRLSASTYPLAKVKPCCSHAIGFIERNRWEFSNPICLKALKHHVPVRSTVEHGSIVLSTRQANVVVTIEKLRRRFYSYVCWIYK